MAQDDPPGGDDSGSERALDGLVRRVADADVEARAALLDALATGHADARARLLEALGEDAPWAKVLLRESVDARLAWAKGLMVDGLRDTAPWAWRCYHAWYHPKVIDICARCLPDPDVAHDCAAWVREHFVGHYAHRATPRRSFPGYIYTMAYHESLKVSHRAARHVATADEPRRVTTAAAASGLLPPPAPNGEAALALRERHALLQRVRDLLPALPAGDRDLLHARFNDERTLKEIATARGCSHQNIDQRLRRIFKKLRRALDGDPGVTP